MVNYRWRDLDGVFATLADPTCRAILARFAQQESLSISALAKPFSIKLSAVMKHLDVLGNAGLITRSKHGRTVEVRLSPAPLRQATEWLRRYERFWSTALDRLLIFTHAELWSEASEQSHSWGWTGSLDRLVRHLEHTGAPARLTTENPT